MSQSKRSGLGKGLDALFMDNETKDSGTVTLRISQIEPNINQPRKQFDENSLIELANSIQQHGIIQPLLVRPLENGSYQLVAGERRWRASRMAGLLEVPVVIKDLTENEAMEIALIENLQRRDLNAIEEALGYEQLMDKYGMTQEKVAERVGKSRPAIANALRLLNLPSPVLDMIKSGDISAGHARALLKLEYEAEIIEVAQKIQQGHYSVRDIERITNQKKEEERIRPQIRIKQSEDHYFKELELAMTNELGRKVKITVTNRQQGILEVSFFSKEDLADLASRIAGEN